MTSIQDDTVTASAPVVQEEPAKPMTAADRIREALGRDKPPKLPTYVSGAGRTEVNPNVLAAEMAAEEARKKKEAQEKALSMVGASTQAQMNDHPAIRTSFPPPTPRASKPTVEVNVGTADAPMWVSPLTIVEIGARLMRVDSKELLEKGRRPHVSRCRGVLIFFLKHYTNLSMSAVGRIFDISSTAVIYACAKVEKLLKEGPTNDLPGPSPALISTMEMELLLGLRRLCQHYSKELPSSEHWPKEPPGAEYQNPFEHASAD